MSTPNGPHDRPDPGHSVADDPTRTMQRVDRPDSDRPGSDHPGSDTQGDIALDRRSVVRREKEAFGGVKAGSAFFGWLTATGIAVLLTALLAAAGTSVGLGTEAGVDVTEAAENPQTVGAAGASALLVILFGAYYCGGYVAGRMARFNGMKQGVAVWLWALVIAVVVALLGAVAGARYDILGQLNSFPRVPVNEGDLTTAGLVAALAVAAASLVGAILGGLAGMRFHRQVDKAGLGG